MQNDEVIWQLLRHNSCSFMAKTTKEIFCRNPYNLTGVCNRSSCPLANSRYATIREHEGVFYLYMKTIERAYMPNNLWERVKLPSSNLEAALQIISDNLNFWPEDLVFKTKQRLLRMLDVKKRMRKLSLKTREKIMTTPRKEIKREARREEKAEKAAAVEKIIEKELVERVERGIYGDLYNYHKKAFENLLKKIDEQEDKKEEGRKVFVEWNDEWELEEDLEDFNGRSTNRTHQDDDDDDDEEEDDDAMDGAESEKVAVMVNRKRGRANSKYALNRKEKDAKRKGRVLVEVEHEDTGSSHLFKTEKILVR